MRLGRRAFLLSLPTLVAALKALPEAAAMPETLAGEITVDISKILGQQIFKIEFPDGAIWQFKGILALKNTTEVEIAHLTDVEMLNAPEALPEEMEYVPDERLLDVVEQEPALRSRGTMLHIEGQQVEVLDIQLPKYERHLVQRMNEDIDSYVVGVQRRSPVSFTVRFDGE